MQTTLNNFDFDSFKEYVTSYPDAFSRVCSSKTQIYDMLYGIAVSIGECSHPLKRVGFLDEANKEKYEGVNGFNKFKEELALSLIRSS